MNELMQYHLCSNSALGDIGLFVSIIVANLECCWASSVTSTDLSCIPSASASVVSLHSALWSKASGEVQVTVVDWVSDLVSWNLFLSITIVVSDTVGTGISVHAADNSAVPFSFSSVVSFNSRVQSSKSLCVT